MRASYERIILTAATIVLILAVASGLYLALINGHADDKSALIYRGVFAGLFAAFLLLFDMKMLEPVAPRPALRAGLASLALAAILWLALAPWPETAAIFYLPATMFGGACLGQWRLARRKRSLA
jgi:peptidoglycan/LPS O-acetylase OafA/YrhL